MKRITAEEPESSSTDFIAENIAQMTRLFPEAFAEGKVNFAVLEELLGDAIDKSEEKYGLNWHGKGRSRLLALQPTTGTLRPCREESVGWDSTKNLMIEGDNLEVLKLLQKSYASTVKLIFIDPPYNTGKDFVYSDNYKDGIKSYLKFTGQVDGNGDKLCSNTEASGRFHTNWLNMMYPRLKLARGLLRHDGFLFMTIDDTEVHHLRQIADEIFGEDNFIANVVWEKKYTRANDAQFFSDNHDHILVYSKDRSFSELSLQQRTADQAAAYKNPDNHPKGPWKATPLHAKSGGSAAPYTFRNGLTWKPPPGTYRRFSDKTMARMEGNDEIWFGSNGLTTPSRKTFLADAKSGVSPVTIWPYKEVGHNHEANNELKQLLGQGVFSNPKPTRLVRRIVELAVGETDEPCIVLDFFAGSGTTGHSVMKQNAADAGCRRYILVQLPEQIDFENREQKTTAAYLTELGKPLNVAEITKERLRCASAELETGSPEHSDLGFRVFKLDSSNLNTWDPDRADMSQSLLDHLEHIKPDRSEDDLFFEILLKFGHDLCVPVERREIAGKAVSTVAGGALVACLAESIKESEVDDLALGIVEWRNAMDQADDILVVFRDSAFENDVAKANMSEILKQNRVKDVRSL